MFATARVSAPPTPTLTRRKQIGRDFRAIERIVAGEPLTDVAQDLGLSQSRLSQRVRRALELLDASVGLRWAEVRVPRRSTSLLRERGADVLAAIERFKAATSATTEEVRVVRARRPFKTDLLVPSADTAAAAREDQLELACRWLEHHAGNAAASPHASDSERAAIGRFFEIALPTLHRRAALGLDLGELLQTRRAQLTAAVAAWRRLVKDEVPNDQEAPILRAAYDAIRGTDGTGARGDMLLKIAILFSAWYGGLTPALLARLRLCDFQNNTGQRLDTANVVVDDVVHCVRWDNERVNAAVERYLLRRALTRGVDITDPHRGCRLEEPLFDLDDIKRTGGGDAARERRVAVLLRGIRKRPSQLPSSAPRDDELRFDELDQAVVALRRADEGGGDLSRLAPADRASALFFLETALPATAASMPGGVAELLGAGYRETRRKARAAWETMRASTAPATNDDALLKSAYRALPSAGSGESHQLGQRLLLRALLYTAWYLQLGPRWLARLRLQDFRGSTGERVAHATLTCDGDARVVSWQNRHAVEAIEAYLVHRALENHADITAPFAGLHGAAPLFDMGRARFRAPAERQRQGAIEACLDQLASSAGFRESVVVAARAAHVARMKLYARRDETRLLKRLEEVARRPLGALDWCRAKPRMGSARNPNESLARTVDDLSPLERVMLVAIYYNVRDPCAEAARTLFGRALQRQIRQQRAESAIETLLSSGAVTRRKNGDLVVAWTLWPLLRAANKRTTRGAATRIATETTGHASS